MSVYGIDVSHWDSVIDWLRIRQDGRVKFAILKASEGVSFVDDQYANNKAGCQSIGMPWGAYHFFRAQYDPAQQARWFFNIVGMGCHVYIADIEAAGEDLANKVRIFVEELKRLGAPTVMIYTGPYFWKDNIGNAAWAKQYPLWIANYGVSYPMIPLPWTAYDIWQYSDRGQVAGINAAVDENWFYGEPQAMYDFFKNGNEVPEIPQEPGIIKVRVNAGGLNIRSAPIYLSDNSNVIGTTTKGKVWLVEDIVYDAGNKKWYQVGKGAFLAGYVSQGILLTEPV